MEVEIWYGRIDVATIYTVRCKARHHCFGNQSESEKRVHMVIFYLTANLYFHVGIAKQWPRNDGPNRHAYTPYPTSSGTNNSITLFRR